MQDIRFEWSTLPNPFLYNEINASSGVIGHVSARSTDIIIIVYNDQSALILSGAPRIGKTALLQYLQTPSQPRLWSWRQEEALVRLQDQQNLDATHFVQIDLSPLENTYQIATEIDIYYRFLKQCGKALYKVYQIGDLPAPTDLKGLREFLRHMNRNQPETRCFIMLDNIDRLGMDTPSFFQGQTEAKTPQERGIALLNNCGAIRALTGLIDEFRNFGVILFLESLPRAKMDAQFSHVSADLAHFSTTTLQIFTWDDTRAFLQQRPEQLGDVWAQHFKEQAGEIIFTPAEQAWIHEQAGSHPYILQQFCFQTFYFKRLRAERHNQWSDLEEEDKQYVVQSVKKRIITFLIRMWKRLQGALDTVGPESRDTLFKFINSFSEKQVGEAITSQVWNDLGPEVQYVLSNEGIVRYDPFRTVYAPGALLSDYLLQKVTETGLTTARLRRLVINFPGAESEPMLLSELEYRLLKTLQHHPKRCTEDELMKAGWNKVIESKNFSQKMFQLRKKLKGHGHTDVIINHYGGLYSLPHPDWLQFLE